jgi:hypothetical protein
LRRHVHAFWLRGTVSVHRQQYSPENQITRWSKLGHVQEVHLALGNGVTYRSASTLFLEIDFGISDDYGSIPELNRWLRRRVRMCYWKRWSKVRTKVRNLLPLGVNKRQAIVTALSSRSDGYPSRTLATQTGMTSDGLQRWGLFSVRALWMKMHGHG